jgi:hypothetical protein
MKVETCKFSRLTLMDQKVILENILWWPEAGSNHRHEDFQSSALPTELSGHKNRLEPTLNPKPQAQVKNHRFLSEQSQLAYRCQRQIGSLPFL